MNFYLKLKHQQARNFREKYINQFLQVSLIILLSIWIIQCTMIIFESRTITITGGEIVRVVQAAQVETPAIQTGNIVVKPAIRTGSTEYRDSQEIPAIETMIRQTFPEEPEIALAIFKTESGLEYDSMNWNCYYWKNGKRTSQQCKIEDRKQAWSVDCGIAQINHIGKTCPQELFNPTENIKIAYSMYKQRGFNPWVVYKMGYHKGNL